MTAFRRTAVVWGLAILLGAAWWLLRAAPGVEGPASGAVLARPIFGPDAPIEVDAIERIRLARRGEPTLVFVRETGPAGTRWVQTEPIPADLDEWSARQLAVEAAMLATTRPAIESGDGSRDGQALGFEPPMAVLELESPAKTARLEFGKRSVAGRAFVRRADGPIEVVSSPLYERAVEVDPREWRSRQLFPESLGRPARIEWTLLDGAIRLERSGERWRLVQPIAARADRVRIEELLVALTRARGEGFLVDRPSDLASFGLDPSVASLSVAAETGDGGGLRQLHVGAPLGVGTADRFAMLDQRPTVVRLGAATQATLFPRLETLVDPVASGVRPSDVKRIEIRGPDGTFELERELDRWTASLEGAPAIACPPEGPQRLLSLLCAERATEIAIAEFPTDRLVATVILFGFDRKPLDVVRVARDPRTGKWGFENGDGVLRIHPPTANPPIDARGVGM